MIEYIDTISGESLYKFYSKEKSKKIIKYSKKNGKLHRDDGPAISVYSKNHNITNEVYYLNGKKHRDDGPAVIKYSYAGNVLSEIYYKNDV